MDTGKYYYRIHGASYEICKDGQHVRGERNYFVREEARKRVYELNGWRYKPCKS